MFDRSRASFWRLRPWRRWLLWAVLGAMVVKGVALGMSLYFSARAPVDSFLVLGGSIRREMYVAEQATHLPNTKVLISGGSMPPCIRILFERANAPITQVWLENCAQSTFENFYYSLPLLKQWRTQKVRLVTSPTHLPRAQWMAQLILGSHGIWVEPDIVTEVGVPGNQEDWIKTALDVTRATFWAILSQGYQPHCDRLVRLSEVDLDTWQRRGFRCEQQAGIDESTPEIIPEGIPEIIPEGIPESSGGD